MNIISFQFSQQNNSSQPLRFFARPQENTRSSWKLLSKFSYSAYMVIHKVSSVRVLYRQRDSVVCHWVPSLKVGYSWLFVITSAGNDSQCRAVLCEVIGNIRGTWMRIDHNNNSFIKLFTGGSISIMTWDCPLKTARNRLTCELQMPY